jgi:aminopeptidase-like protein
MGILEEFDQGDLAEFGRNLYQFASALFPLCRSITGEGLHQTLSIIQKQIPLQLTEVPSGTAVFDWTVPREWNIRDAYIRIPGGERVVDFQKSNLHVVNYSKPVRTTLSLNELKPKLFTIPDRPDWIPYRTTYYKEDWGFCLSHNQLMAMADRSYEVCIDSTLEDGQLTYGECYLPGRSAEEILISCHACHPSLANDNLSGLVVATHLAKFLSGRDLRYSYRFLFIPGTIGAITWLARNKEAAGRVRNGLVLTCIGDQGAFHYKKSRQGNAEVDRAAIHVLRHCSTSPVILDFAPYGYDERQYCSPGFNLAVGCLMRSVWGTFPEYHTSADNLSFIHPKQLADSMRICTGIFDILENDRRYHNLNPFCEPQLGKRNLYRSVGGGPIEEEMNARLWVLNLSDGQHSLLDIAERSGVSFSKIHQAAQLLRENGLLAPASETAEEESGAVKNRLHQDESKRL